jgi:hypothetical protein
MLNEVQAMNKRLAVVALAVALCGPAVLAGQVDVGVSVSDGRLQSFHLAVGDHYRVAPDAVIGIRTRGRLLDEELPVVYFLAARAQIGPQVIVDLRLGKRSWLDIAVHFGLSPEIFFVPVHMETIGPPYGNAYGYYRKYGRSGDWRKFAVTDREVIDLVNLRFMSEYHGLPPDEVIAMRGHQKSFVGVHDELGKKTGKAKGSAGKPPKSEQKGKKK